MKTFVAAILVAGLMVAGQAAADAIQPNQTVLILLFKCFAA
ncbi:Uncharacterised protein [Burkholderia pseudomallei]|nr:hypothetical protein [Burkholderia pseudomallei]AIP12897.1 hypothetical protein DP60_2576 [Burkholderia pseudomallei]AJX06281.1 hypothetical protein BBW_2983 [Burkholderia pseudomallei 1026b]MCV9976596.1 hypothetical protein [Burkholderia pseudomallei]CAJ2771850.1 Uncharacterised protein [Burkholderia pseudomallei]CAJ2850866.1 Uncharacterised protein [Burkholderia pseudomallei]